VDAAVARAMAKWPNVPAVYGWLAIRSASATQGFASATQGFASATQGFERVGNAALREFIGRNYEHDAGGRWYFQNGPQRVYVALAYTPLVAHYEGDELFDHCGRVLRMREAWVDDEGSVLIAGGRAVALLDDRDLARVAEAAGKFPTVRRDEVERRFGFVREPAPE
jgi:hypothetical protein